MPYVRHWEAPAVFHTVSPGLVLGQRLLLPLRAAENVEHEAWLDACKELEAVGVTINDQDRLAALLNMWGEKLAQLRMTQERADNAGWRRTREVIEEWRGRLARA